MRTILSPASLLGAVLLFVFVTAAACSGSSGGGNGGGGSGAFCQLLSSYATQCNRTDACTQAEVQGCATLSTNFSSALISAADSCATPPYDCADGGSPTTSACIQQKLAAATPTAAQIEVETTFCGACPDGAAMSNPHACSQFFAPPRDAGTSGPGYLLLEFSDSLAAQVGTKCAGAGRPDGGLFDCASSFELCSALTFAFASNTPAACQGTGKSIPLFDR